MVRLCAALLFFSSLAFAGNPPEYRQWVSDCAKLPANRELKGRLPTILPLPTFADFETALDGFLALVRKGEISEKEKWVNGAPDPAVFFDITRSWFGGKEIPFQPFAAKLVLPPDATAIAIGDLHTNRRCKLLNLPSREGCENCEERSGIEYCLPSPLYLAWVSRNAFRPMLAARVTPA